MPGLKATMCRKIRQKGESRVSCKMRTQRDQLSGECGATQDNPIFLHLHANMYFLFQSMVNGDTLDPVHFSESPVSATMRGLCKIHYLYVLSACPFMYINLEFTQYTKCKIILAGLRNPGPRASEFDSHIYFRYCIHRSGTYNIHVEYCTCRKKDGCNGAADRGLSWGLVTSIIGCLIVTRGLLRT